MGQVPNYLNQKGGVNYGCLPSVVELMEALAMSGTAVSDEEIVMITLEGLGVEYDSFVTSFTSIPSNLVSFQELQGMLSDQERWMKALVTFLLSTL